MMHPAIKNVVTAAFRFLEANLGEAPDLFRHAGVLVALRVDAAQQRCAIVRRRRLPGGNGTDRDHEQQQRNSGISTHQGQSS